MKLRKRSLILGAALAAILALGASTVPATWAAMDLASGLTGWWRFDEGSGVVAFDSSGAGNNGLLAGSAFFTTDASMGGVVEFAGPSASVTVPHDASLEPVTGTVEVWFKANKVQQADLICKKTDRLLRTGGGGSFYAYGLRLTKEGTVYAVITNDDPNSAYRQVYATSPRGSIKAGQWYHAAMRWDGSTLSLFINGRLRAATPYDPVPGTGLSYSGNSELAIGSALLDSPDGRLEFLGQMADARFFSQALSESEIAAHAAEKQASSGGSKGANKK
jgi:hypothetical protein